MISKSNISRREAVCRMGAAAAFSILLPRAGRSETVGAGAWTYTWVDGWCKLPETHRFGNTHGVQVDGQGRVLVHSQGAVPHATCIFDPDGKFVSSWGAEFTSGAHGFQLVREDGQEFLYLALTSQHLCVKTTLEGKEVWRLEFPKECEAYGGKPDRFVPTNIAVARNGDFYVADGYGLSLIHRYDKQARYQGTFGVRGAAPGQLNCPHGIWIDTRSGAEELLIADRGNNRLQWFSLDGKPLRIVQDELRMPCHFDERGGTLLIPDLKGRVTLFDKENKLLAHLGDNPEAGQRGNNGVPREQWKAGAFVAPHGACFDAQGNILVAEWVKPGRVTLLRRA